MTVHTKRVAVSTATIDGIDVGEPLGTSLARWAGEHGERTALISGAERMSFTDLHRRADRLAAALHGAGVRAGDRVMVQMPNGTGLVALLFACFRTGAIPILAMPAQGARDIHALCALARPVAYCAAGTLPDQSSTIDYAELGRDIARAHPSVRLVILDCAQPTNDAEASGIMQLAALDAEPLTLPEPTPSDVAVLLLSGGTTGTPKLIPRTHADYTYNFRKCAQLCGLDETSVYLAILPIAHNFTLACPGILGALSCGAQVVLSDTASCDEAMPLIARAGVTHLALVPALARLWVEARVWEESDLTSLRLIQVGGARLDANLACLIRDVLGTNLQQVFGMAEGLICLTRPDDPVETVLHTQGRPISALDEIRIVDEDERDVPTGRTGVLLTRGPYTIRRYYAADDQSARSFTKDGYYRTGDLVRRDESGNLIVEGRVKEQINRAGEKIAPAEIEAMLRDCPGVIEAVVVPVPDDRLGERSCAFLRGDARVIATDTIRAALQRQGCSSFKLPDQIETIDAWPVTAVGKIDRKALVERAAGQRGRALRRYHERRIPIEATPLDLATGLLSRLQEATYSLYERHGEWSIGLGAAATITVAADGTVRTDHDGRLEQLAGDPCRAVADALKSLPIADWRAYGRAEFEIASILQGVADVSDRPEHPLLKLMVPESEIRLSAGEALMRSFDPEALDRLEAMMRAPGAACTTDGDPMRPVAENTMAREEYEARVASAVDEIRAGDYQKVILSRRVMLPETPDLPLSFRYGRRSNTPARSFFLRDEDFRAFGFSPETVVEVTADGQVSTQPLAGTRALTGDPDRDQDLREELAKDTKEIAEHAVSVKLAIAELTGICDPASVHVGDFMTVLCRGSVQHLASRVHGRLKAGHDAWDAFAALFPAVTASGIPKRPAIDSIRRHERAPRGLYSGCVMIVDAGGMMDAALVLRSIFQIDGRCHLQAGAGLVALSSPAREWTETQEKLASIDTCLRARPGSGLEPDGRPRDFG